MKIYRETILFIFLFFSLVSAQQTLIRRAELGDSTAALRTIINSYDIDSTVVKQLIGDTATVLRAEMDAIEANVTILQYGDWSTPEEYQRTGSTVTQSVQKAWDSAGTRPILFQDTYTITDSIIVDGTDKKFKVEFTSNAKIVSSVAAATYNYYANHGHVAIRNADKVEMKGFNLEITNSDSMRTSDNGLVIENCNEVILDGGNIRGANYAGIRGQNNQNFTVKNMLFDSCLYAGIMLVKTKHSYIVGNTFNEIGDTSVIPTTGYGIAFSHQFGTGQDNEDAYLSGNKAYRMYRKAYDIHGCKNAIIDGNFIKGFGYGGIYAVNEGDNVALNEKYVSDVFIINNIIEQDSAWVVGLNYKTSGTNYTHPIQAGSYVNVPYAGGALKIENNILKNISYDSLRAPISLFSGSGEAHPLMSIKGNYIEADMVYTGQGLIYLNGTLTDPINVEIENNTLKGSADNAINIESGRTIKLGKNTIDGTFTNAYNILGAADTTDNGSLVLSTGDIFRGTFQNIVKGTTGSAGDVYIFKDMTIKGTADTITNIPTNIEQITSGTYNGKMLPNKISKNQGTTEFWIENGDVAPDTLALLKTNTIYSAGSFPGGTAKIDYEIEVISANNGFQGTFYVTAYCADSANTPVFYYQITKSEIVRGVEATYEPTFYWGTGTTEKTFYMVATATSTSYYVKAKHSAWRLRPELSLE